MALRLQATLPPVDQIERKAIKALRNSLNGTLNRAGRKIQIRLRRIIREAITETPEYKSINGGMLQGELGLPSPTLLDNIIDQWVNTVSVRVRPVRFSSNNIKGGFVISAIQRDWQDVLRNPSAQITTEKGAVLPWLEWLLLMGNRVIVRDYDVVFGGRGVRRSRSGKAIMVKGRGKRWRVPPQFSGTPRNNFVTRALDGIAPMVESMIQAEVLKQVR